jgi:hypothetical protein
MEPNIAAGRHELVERCRLLRCQQWRLRLSHIVALPPEKFWLLHKFAHKKMLPLPARLLARGPWRDRLPVRDLSPLHRV